MSRRYALAGRSVVAILVVHVGLRLVPAVVFRVGTDRDALSLVDGLGAVVVRQTGLQKLLGVCLRGVNVGRAEAVVCEDVGVADSYLLVCVVGHGHNVRNPDLLCCGVVLPAVAVCGCGRLA